MENMRYLCRWVWRDDSPHRDHFVMAYLNLESPDMVCFQSLTRNELPQDRHRVEPDNCQTVSDLSDEGITLAWKGGSGEKLSNIPRTWFVEVAELAIIAIAGQFRP